MTLAPPSFEGFPFLTQDRTAIAPTRAGLALWLDALSGVTTDAGTARVAAWSSRVESLALVQSATSRMPLLVESAQNGLPVVRGDGADDLLATAGAFPWSAATTIFAVARETSAQTGGRYVCGQTLSNDVAQSLKYLPNKAQLEFAASSSTTGSVATPAGAVDPTQMHVLCGVLTDTTSEIFVDGASGGSAGSGVGYVSSTAPFLLFNRNAATANNILGGDVGEILVYSRALLPAERRAAEGYLKLKWGTP